MTIQAWRKLRKLYVNSHKLKVWDWTHSFICNNCNGLETLPVVCIPQSSFVHPRQRGQNTSTPAHQGTQQLLAKYQCISICIHSFGSVSQYFLLHRQSLEDRNPFLSYYKNPDNKIYQVASCKEHTLKKKRKKKRLQWVKITTCSA